MSDYILFIFQHNGSDKFNRLKSGDRSFINGNLKVDLASKLISVRKLRMEHLVIKQTIN